MGRALLAGIRMRHEIYIIKKKYHTTEQYMMASKARLFGDDEVFDEIMETSNPHDYKKLGRKIRGFEQEPWNAKKYDIVVEGNKATFGQNPSLSASSYYQRSSRCHSCRHYMRQFWRFTSTAGTLPIRCLNWAFWKRLVTVRRMQPGQSPFSTGSILINTRK